MQVYCEVAIETSIKITRAFVAMRKTLLTLSLPAKLSEIQRNIDDLREEVNDILADQNDINESTRMQLENITLALAELQAKEPKQKPRRRIGFIQDEDK